MTFTEAVAVLEDFCDVDDERELERLGAAVASLSASGEVPRAIPSLLGVFERFPVGDGYGVFWTLLHLIESARGSYEEPLLASLRRSPSLFGVMMIGRGLSVTDGRTPTDVLLEVIRNENAPPEVRALAKDQLKHGGST